MIERWLPIKGFPNYEISNCGNIKNIKKIDNEPYLRADIVPSFDLTQLDQVFIIKTMQFIDD